MLCFPRFDMPWFSVFFLPCLLFSLYTLKTIREAWAYGFLLSSMVAIGGFHWIVYVGINFGNLPLPLATLLLLLYCLVAAPAMVAIYVIGLKIRFKVELLPLFWRPIFWAALYTGLEFLFSYVKIFPEHLGNTMIYFLPLAQAASIGGVALLSFFPLYLGACFYYLRWFGRRALPSFGLALSLILIFWIWGKQQIKSELARPSDMIRIGIIQHNMEEVEKLALKSSTRSAVEKTITSLSEKTLALSKKDSKIDLLLWPETSYPLMFPTVKDEPKSMFANGYANLVRSTVIEAGAPLLFGGYETEKEKDYNAGILLDRYARLLGTYRKEVLLIGGEYLPFADTFPILKELNPQMGDFARGPGPIPVKFPWNSRELSLGVNICYEAILPPFMRGLAKNGTDLFVNLTKDSWFGDTFEPWQHFQLSLLRSVEHRIPMVRATNTGLSGLVLTTGEVKLISDPYQEAETVVEIPIPKERHPTIYTLLGDWFAIACLFFSAIFLVRAYRI